MKFNSMTFNSWLATLTVGALAVAAPALFASDGARAAAAPVTTAWEAPTEASGLLSGLNKDAVRVRELSDRLMSLDMQYGENYWQYDANVLDRARTAVNAMDRDLQSLERIKSDAAPWQRDEINRVAPSVVELSDYTRNAIHFLNRNHNYLFAPSYRNDANYMYMKARTIATSIHQFDRYASARHEVHHLGDTLGISS
jgi:hypothetical protein